MDIQLLTRDQAPVACTSAIPAPLARYHVPHARPCYYAGEFGALLLYEQTAPGLSILHKSYFIRQTTTLQETAGTSAFYLCFSITRALRFQPFNLPKVRIPEGQFNIFHVPAIQRQYWFEKGKKYMVCELYITAGMLEPLQTQFSQVSEFLLNARLGFSGQLGHTHAHLTPAMLQLLQQMKDCIYTGRVREEYLQALSARLLLLAVTQLTMVRSAAAEVKLQPYELSRLREAWEYLLQHLEQPGTVMELSHVVGLNDFKLKRGFKQLYGITVFEFVQEARMKKAKRLLHETEMSVHAVAISVGYKNISSFTVAFKKKYGALPSEVQRKVTGDGANNQ